jgi:hypothetical protein
MRSRLLVALSSFGLLMVLGFLWTAVVAPVPSVFGDAPTPTPCPIHPHCFTPTPSPTPSPTGTPPPDMSEEEAEIEEEYCEN